MPSIPVAVLGATGSVGQRFVSLLDGHPWFKVVALTGSDRSIGKPYALACRWILSEPMPHWAQEMTVQPSSPAAFSAQLAFSALPAGQAKEIEPLFAKAGFAVCSNASAFRREADVPLLLPEVNAAHIALIERQRKKRGWPGYIVTNPNCTSAGLTVALKALDDAFGLRKVFVVSLQALSGAGYPGVSSLDMIDNVVPYIGGEEEKVEWEPRKMLGKLGSAGVDLANIGMSAQCNRVAVIDGHMLNLSVEFDAPPSPEAVSAALSAYQPPVSARNLPSTPNPVLLVRNESDRPQPRLDRLTGKGMTTVVGRVRRDPLLHLKFVLLSHNTVRGAAGGSIYNAELLAREGYL